MADNDNLTGLTVEPGADPRLEPIPHEERTRRALMIVFGIMWGVLLVAQVWLALALSPDRYQAVGAVLGGATTLVTGALGAAAVYYWTSRPD